MGHGSPCVDRADRNHRRVDSGTRYPSPDLGILLRLAKVSSRDEGDDSAGDQPLHRPAEGIVPIGIQRRVAQRKGSHADSQCLLVIQKPVDRLDQAGHRSGSVVANDLEIDKANAGGHPLQESIGSGTVAPDQAGHGGPVTVAVPISVDPARCLSGKVHRGDNPRGIEVRMLADAGIKKRHDHTLAINTGVLNQIGAHGCETHPGSFPGATRRHSGGANHGIQRDIFGLAAPQQRIDLTAGQPGGEPVDGG